MVLVVLVRRLRHLFASHMVHRNTVQPEFDRRYFLHDKNRSWNYYGIQVWMENVW